MVIETLDESLRNRRHEVSETVSLKFRQSVRAILANQEHGPPVIIGSCLLIRIEDKNYAVTAAHITDELEKHALYVAGTVGTEPVQILGEVKMTKSPSAGREFDKIDLAFWEIDKVTQEKFGDVSFIGEDRFSKNKISTENRLYLAMGYPASVNKKGVNNPNKSIKTSLSKYTAELHDGSSLENEFGVSGDKHLFLKFHKYSETSTGEKRNTFKPDGLSGGALVDLGNFADPAKYVQASEPTGYLSGMIIERKNRHESLIAIKIQVIMEAIRSQACSVRL